MKTIVTFGAAALRIHVSQPTINILTRTDCKFEYEYRGETYLKVTEEHKLRMAVHGQTRGQCVLDYDQVTDLKVHFLFLRVKEQRQPTG